MTTATCPHGHLARSCELCERDREIEQLRAEVEALRDERDELRRMHVLVRDAALSLRDYPPDAVLGGNAADAFEALASAYDDFQCWQAMEQTAHMLNDRDQARAEAAKGPNERAIRMLHERDEARARVAELEELVRSLRGELGEEAN